MTAQTRDYTIRPADVSEAARAAALHIGGITEGFLPSLGSAFLTRLYRRAVLSPGSWVLVAEQGNAVVGFVAGTEAVGRLYREFLWRDGLVAAGSAAWPMVRSWRRTLETLRYGRSQPGSTQGPSLPDAELLAVAVDDSARGRGVGGALVAGFQDACRQRGVPSARVIVGAGNSGAISLYQRHGFTAAASFEVHAGSRSIALVWTA
jgi:ribosomal protein S18 acetylase RimI-like enzyme